MDIATLIGLIAGIFFIVYSIFLSGDISALLAFYDLPSIMIVVGGTFASALINYPMSRIKTTIGIVKHVFSSKPLDFEAMTIKIIDVSKMARKEGLLAIEHRLDEYGDDQFLRKGLMLIIDGADPELVKGILETSLESTDERHSKGIAVIESMATYAPAYGMIGTLIGLINMLKNLSDIDKVGPNMSVALVTTFYGVVLANLVFNPIAGKLKYLNSQELLYRQMMIEGILSIQGGENPRIIEEKLRSFVAKKQEVAIET